jgi:hypothetical protein
MTERLSPDEARAIQRQVRWFSEQGWGIAVGCLFGLGLFAATNVLVLRGGEDVGAHLGLLQIFFPGFHVSFLGSLVGFVYAFVLGYGIGWTIGALLARYNRAP